MMSDHETSPSTSPSATNPDIDTSDHALPASPTNQHTTPFNDHLNAQAPGELSPPRSQDTPTALPPRPQLRNRGDSSIDLVDDDLEDVDPLYQPEGGGTMDGASEANGGPVVKGNYVPGSGWNNKKAQDELYRAMENVVDQDFNLQEFGDPLLDDMTGNGAPQATVQA